MKPELNIVAQSYLDSHWELQLIATDNQLADWFFSAVRGDRIVYAIGTHGALSYFRGKPDVAATCDFLAKKEEHIEPKTKHRTPAELVICQRRMDKAKFSKYEYLAIKL